MRTRNQAVVGSPLGELVLDADGWIIRDKRTGVAVASVTAVDEDNRLRPSLAPAVIPQLFAALERAVVHGDSHADDWVGAIRAAMAAASTGSG